MKEPEDKHWTADDELIERFVLNRLNPEERNELEDHLRICEVCKQALRAEQVLVAGIRRSGREQFKVELLKKVSSLPEKNTPWVQILSAAAVIVVLLTLGIYNRWFESQQPQPSLVPIIPTQPSQSAQSEDQTSSAVAEQSTTPEGAASTSPQQGVRQIGDQQRSSPEDQAQSDHGIEKSAPPTAMKRKGDANRLLASKTEATSVVRTEDVSQRGAGAAISAQPSADMAIQAQPETAQREAISHAENESGSIWIEGVVLPTPAEEFRDRAKTLESRSVTNAYGLKKSSAANAKMTQNVSEGLISLSQQNSLALPSSQQRLQQLSNSSNVMTKVTRIGNKTQMTLYLDSLVDKNALANATVEALRNDSLILHFSNQRIAYKLPAGWILQRDATPAK